MTNYFSVLIFIGFCIWLNQRAKPLVKMLKEHWDIWKSTREFRKVRMWGLK